MKRILSLVAAAALAVTAVQADVEPQRCIGTIVAIDGKRVTVRLADGKDRVFTITERTKVTPDKKTPTLEKGQHVHVRFEEVLVPVSMEVVANADPLPKTATQVVGVVSQVGDDVVLVKSEDGKEHRLTWRPTSRYQAKVSERVPKELVAGTAVVATYDVVDGKWFLVNVDVAGSPRPKVESKGMVAGQVLEGDRPQPSLTVHLLLINSGKVVGSQVTDKDGQFVFRDVPEGTYSLVTTKESSRSFAAKDVTVDRAGPRDVKLALTRVP